MDPRHLDLISRGRIFSSKVDYPVPQENQVRAQTGLRMGYVGIVIRRWEAVWRIVIKRVDLVRRQ